MSSSSASADAKACADVQVSCREYLKTNAKSYHAERVIILMKVFVILLTILAGIAFLIKDKSLSKIANKLTLFSLAAVIAAVCVLVMVEHKNDIFAAFELWKPVDKRKLIVVSKADGSVYFGFASFLLVLTVMACVPAWRKFMWELF